jgi:hypothetical protein
MGKSTPPADGGNTIPVFWRASLKNWGSFAGGDSRIGGVYDPGTFVSEVRDDVRVA